MRVSCPSCGATYDVPDDVLGTAGRRLRCARCAHEWLPLRAPALPRRQTAPVLPQMPPPAEPEPPVAPSQPLLVASPPLVEKQPGPPPSPANVTAAWAASLLLLAGLALAAYLFRDTVQDIWPPSRAVYAALGLA